MRRNRSLTVLVLALLAGAILVGGYLFSKGDETSLEHRYLTAEIGRGSVHRVVSSTGTLEAVVTVQVGSQVSGRIQELHADFNSVVEKGQLLAVIDPANYEARLEKARAGLATAHAAVSSSEASLTNRQAELQAAKANLEVAQVEEKQSQGFLTRYEQLFEDRLVTVQDLDDARTALEEKQARIRQYEAQIVQSEATIEAAEAQKEQALANVQQAEAELNIAKIDLAYTRITSPIDGVVIERNVDIGQTVAATLQAPTLFLIANDLSRMRVIAQVDEADIGSVSERASVEFTVDSFPSEVFKGKISEIRLGKTDSDSQTASNVVVYNVIVDVNNPALKLRPGMTATVDFTVARAEDVLMVPNSALRFVPNGHQAIPKSSSTIPETELLERGGAEDPIIEPVTSYTATEQYGIRPGPKVHFPEAQGTRAEQATVWILDSDGQIEARQVALGVTDGVNTAVLTGNLRVGEEVIIREFESSEEYASSASPFGPPMPQRRN